MPTMMTVLVVVIGTAASVFGASVFLASAARAERPPEPRSQAATVIEGVVEAVVVVSGAYHDHDVVTVRVAAVTKGSTAIVGAVFKVVGYRLARTPPPEWVGPSGHIAPPTVGARIIAYVSSRDWRDGFEGVYKDYWELAPTQG